MWPPGSFKDMRSSHLAFVGKASKNVSEPLRSLPSYFELFILNELINKSAASQKWLEKESHGFLDD